MSLPDLGIQITKVQGEEAWALCPGPHAARTGQTDNHPSWSVHLITGQHHCFSCGWGGPFILLVKEVEDLDDSNAEKWVKDHGGMDYVISRLEGKQSWKKAQAEEVTEARLVMFDDPPDWALDSKDVTLEACQAYGVRWNTDRMVIGEGKDRHVIPPDTWIFPIRDPFDNRLLGWQQKGKNHFNNYPRNVEKALTVFGYHLLEPGMQAKVEESPVDAVRLHSYGIKGAVSTYGAHVSDAQVEALSDRTDDIMWCFDNDGPGRRAEITMFKKHRHRFRKMWWAVYDPHDPKDHGEMDIEDVRWSLANAVSKVRFRV